MTTCWEQLLHLVEHQVLSCQVCNDVNLPNYYRAVPQHTEEMEIWKKKKRTCVLFYFLLPNQPHTGEVRPETVYHIIYALHLPLSSGEQSSFNIQEQATDLKWERTVGVQGVEWIVMVKNLAKRKPQKKKTPLDHCIPVLTSTCKVVTSTSTSKVVKAMY